ncbi:MAG: hypothetical protein ACRCTY_09700 [Candidatus Adiutrix sp.]
MPLMTDEDRDKLLDVISEAEEAGNEEEALRLKRMIPIGPIAAKAIKDYIPNGKELLKMFNMSEANAKYGDGWLDD